MQGIYFDDDRKGDYMDKKIDDDDGNDDNDDGVHEGVRMTATVSSLSLLIKRLVLLLSSFFHNQIRRR